MRHASSSTRQASHSVFHVLCPTCHTARPWSFVVNHLPFTICLLAYLTVAVLYGVTMPIFETPDANGHYAYIHELTEGRGLPVQGTASGDRVTGYVASHPPVYYTLCAILTFWVSDDVDFGDWAWWNPRLAMGSPGSVANKNILIHTPAERFPWSGTPLTMHVARLVSTVLGAVAVVATYGTALELFPGRKWFAVGATSLAAFNPMFIFTSARVSNDAAIVAFGSLAIWGAVHCAVSSVPRLKDEGQPSTRSSLSRRRLVLTGVMLGLAVLSKLSGIVLVPVVALALLFGVSRNTLHKERPTHLLVDAVILFGTAAFVCGWWFVRNLFLYGELMGVDAWLSHTATVRPEPIGILNVIPELEGLEKSYWAMFGWFNVPVAPWMYRFWWVLVRLGGVGLLIFAANQWTARRPARSTRRGLAILAFAFLLVLGSVWHFITIVLGAQGRYLMPVVIPISILLTLGLSQFLPRRWEPGLAVFLGGSHLALTLISLFAFILPVYATPKVIQESQVPAEMEHFNLTFDGTSIRLLGGSIEAEAAHLGDPVPVSLYWRADTSPQRDLLAYVQLLGRDMEPIAGVDCYPGRGTFPPTLWESDVIYRDRYVLPVASDVEVPTVAALQAGLYAQDDGRLTIRRSPDQPPLDLLLLDLVPVRPAEPLSDDVTHRVDARLGESVKLVGYDLSIEEVGAGDIITVTLVWRAEGSPGADYTTFVHLLDESGTLVAQDDHPPLGGAYPTSFWTSGDVVRDSHRLTIQETAPGTCTLLVGMYNPETGERLPAYEGREGTRLENDIIVAGKVAIE